MSFTSEEGVAKFIEENYKDDSTKWNLSMAFKKIADMSYVPNGHIRQKLDLYLPETGKKNPLIVYIHGGAFMYGSKESTLLPKRLLEKGYAIASLDYRLSGDAIFPATLEDCKAAVRWLRAHGDEYNLDTDRIVAWGESAGGHQVEMLGTTAHIKEFDVGENTELSSAVQGVVDYYGPTDFLEMDRYAPAAAPFKHDDPDSPESKYLGVHIVKDPDLVQKANPISYITQDTPPFFIAHGTEDLIVPFHQSVLLHEALSKAGLPITFHPVDGTNHVFEGITSEQEAALNQATDKFLESIFGK